MLVAVGVIVGVLVDVGSGVPVPTGSLVGCAVGIAVGVAQEFLAAYTEPTAFAKDAVDTLDCSAGTFSPLSSMTLRNC